MDDVSFQYVRGRSAVDRDRKYYDPRRVTRAYLGDWLPPDTAHVAESVLFRYVMLLGDPAAEDGKPTRVPHLRPSEWCRMVERLCVLEGEDLVRALFGAMASERWRGEAWIDFQLLMKEGTRTFRRTARAGVRGLDIAGPLLGSEADDKKDGESGGRSKSKRGFSKGRAEGGTASAGDRAFIREWVAAARRRMGSEVSLLVEAGERSKLVRFCDLESFLEMWRRSPQIIWPAERCQYFFRRKFFGERFWSTVAEKVRQMKDRPADLRAATIQSVPDEPPPPPPKPALPPGSARARRAMAAVAGSDTSPRPAVRFADANESPLNVDSRGAAHVVMDSQGRTMPATHLAEGLGGELGRDGVDRVTEAVLEESRRQKRVQFIEPQSTETPPQSALLKTQSVPVGLRFRNSPPQSSPRRLSPRTSPRPYRKPSPQSSTRRLVIANDPSNPSSSSAVTSGRLAIHKTSPQSSTRRLQAGAEVAPYQQPTIIEDNSLHQTPPPLLKQSSEPLHSASLREKPIKGVLKTSTDSPRLRSTRFRPADFANLASNNNTSSSSPRIRSARLETGDLAPVHGGLRARARERTQSEEPTASPLATTAPYVPKTDTYDKLPELDGKSLDEYVLGRFANGTPPPTIPESKDTAPEESKEATNIPMARAKSWSEQNERPLYDRSLVRRRTMATPAIERKNSQRAASRRRLMLAGAAARAGDRGSALTQQQRKYLNN